MAGSRPPSCFVISRGVACFSDVCVGRVLFSCPTVRGGKALFRLIVFFERLAYGVLLRFLWGPGGLRKEYGISS